MNAEVASPTGDSHSLGKRSLRPLTFASAVLAFVVYAATAARTITWWDGSSYPLAAVTLGIPGSPGSLLLTLFGWVVSRIPIVHPVAFRLNLSAAALAAILVGLVSWLGARLATPEGREPGGHEQFAGAFAGLTFALGITPWTYATQFTPYVLSALWTALILVATLAWWRRPDASSGRLRLFVLFLLLGLDLSVHRTNTLLLPAAVIWIAIRSPTSRAWLGDGASALGGYALGLAFHLLLMPIAARHPSYMVEDPGSWAGWWSYVTIEQKGGAFLVNLFPRTANFFSDQMADYLACLRGNLSTMWFVPAALAALGWILILRHHPRRALGLLAFFLFAGPGAVVYFNLPRHYMRPIDRHYLPSLVILAPWMAVSAASLLRRASVLPGRVALVPGLALALAMIPFGEWRANRATCDLSRTRFAEAFARDLLEPLPRGAIVLTNGDNDSIPLWYLQQVEGVRPDVRVVNLPLTNTGPFVAQLRRSDPDLAQLLASEPLPRVLMPQQIADAVTTVVEPRTGLGLPAGVAPPETIRFEPTGMVLGQDRVVLDLLRLTRWRRPIYMACTVAPGNLKWLWPYARLDGLAYRVIPSRDSTVHDVDHLREQLLHHVSYAGIADTSVAMEATSRDMCSNYLAALNQLAVAELERGRPDDALTTLDFLEARTPPARLGADPGQFAALRTRIETEAAKEPKR